MNPVAATLVIAGSVLTLLAGVGILRLSTTYSRFHAAGKASPVAFFVIAGGVGIELGFAAAAQLAVAVAALALTLPVGVHLLFRASHRSNDRTGGLHVDDLVPAERLAARASVSGEAVSERAAPDLEQPET